jgi:CubicO group peptidase (beta-lactamase class C family)
MGADSLVPLWSCSKGAASLVAALAVESGCLDPDAPVTRYWPEFARAGKEDVTVAQMLSHQAGLVSVDGGLSFNEFVEPSRLADRLALQRPQWAPGTAHGYHALTFGVLIGELVQRVVGSGLQEQFEVEIRAPIDAALYLGLPRSEESRVLTCHPSPHRVAQATQDNPLASAELFEAAVAVRDIPDEIGPDWIQTRPVRAFGQPAVGGVGNARGLARIYARCVTGIATTPPLLTAGTIEQIRRPRAEGWDLCLPFETRFGLGFQLDSTISPMAGSGSLGHDGAAGSIGFAHPEKRLAFGFVSDHAPPPPGLDPLIGELIGALA